MRTYFCRDRQKERNTKCWLITSYDHVKLCSTVVAIHLMTSCCIFFVHLHKTSTFLLDVVCLTTLGYKRGNWRHACVDYRGGLVSRGSVWKGGMYKTVGKHHCWPENSLVYSESCSAPKGFTDCRAPVSALQPPTKQVRVRLPSSSRLLPLWGRAGNVLWP